MFQIELEELGAIASTSTSDKRKLHQTYIVLSGITNVHISHTAIQMYTPMHLSYLVKDVILSSKKSEE